MKQNRRQAALFFTILAVAFSAMLYAASAETPDPVLITKGRDLFNAKEGLGVKFACIMCHKNDKAIKKSSVQKLGDKLPASINKYITTKAKGKALAANSPEMQALVAYIRYEHSK